MQEDHLSAREILAHDLSFKALLRALPESAQFAVEIYAWRDQETLPSGKVQEAIWERVAGPILFDTEAAAQLFANEELRLFSGVLTMEKNPGELLWLQEYSGDPEAVFLKGQTHTARLLLKDESSAKITYEKIEPLRIAAVHTLYIVETPDEWFLGALENENCIDCWQRFSSFEAALDAISIPLI